MPAVNIENVKNSSHFFSLKIGRSNVKAGLTITKMCGKTGNVVLAKRERERETIMDNLLDAVCCWKEKREVVGKT